MNYSCYIVHLTPKLYFSPVHLLYNHTDSFVYWSNDSNLISTSFIVAQKSFLILITIKITVRVRRRVYSRPSTWRATPPWINMELTLHIIQRLCVLDSGQFNYRTGFTFHIPDLSPRGRTLMMLSRFGDSLESDKGAWVCL